MPKLTDQHLTRFKKAVKKWQDKLGLQGWFITVQWSPDSEALAWVACNAPNRRADMHLCREWSTLEQKPTPKFLEEMAFHELCHVFLADITLAATRNTPEATWKLLDSSEHQIIRTLEKLLFPQTSQ